MKNLLFLLCPLFFSINAWSQNNDDSEALKLVALHQKSLNLSDQDIQNSIVSSTYFNKHAGTRMVYLQQSFAGLPVYNQLLVLAFKNNALVSVAGSRVHAIDQKVQSIPLAPSISPETALKNACVAKGISIPKVAKTTGTNTKINFGKLNTSHEDITAELMWIPLKDGKDVKLAWQVYIAPLTTSDYWLLRIDAHTGKLIDESNLTVYCKFGDAKQETETCNHDKTLLSSGGTSSIATSSPSLVNTANYLVIPFPAESPNHPGGAPSLRTNPWTLAGATNNATTLGWHNDGTNDYTISRGNNVWAQEDRDNNNNTFGTAATSSTTPDPLNFTFTPNLTVSPIQTTPAPNQQFAITNLFYWNNIIHDLTYQYGFDEVSGNFQNNNLGRGGAGSDYVIADAQDAGGTNNANFSTPVDGQRPRMQMYLWSGSPQKDGDLDNGIVTHEFTHGISNRLTGGPATASCLGNDENMGEGWSDYYALMYTQDWANANLNTGFTSPRGIGTYAVSQGVNGLGIRSQRYCTNFSVNNKVYTATLPIIPHDRGEIWCAALWDMTWNIIQQVGSINPNIFDAQGGGGNTIALRLVTEGMKLQPCSPGFIDGRNAILQADQILYGGQFSCAIREAFRRRGMGSLASQGSSGSVTDQVPDFNGFVNLKLTQAGMTTVPEGQNILYTNTLSNECGALTNFVLRDTLPANVTFVSATNGGVYDAATRVISWTVNQPSGSTQTYGFTVNVNTGTWFPTVDLLNDPVNSTAIPATWTTTATPAANVWTVSTTISNSSPNAYYVQNLTVAANQKLELANAILLPANTSPRFYFAHRYNTEAGWDGGVVEISTNNGSTWTDLGSKMVVNGYTSSLGSAPTNVLSGRAAFSGTTTAFATTTIDLSQYAGQNVKLRFQFGSDDNTSAPTSPAGWWIDDILLQVKPVVNMRSSLFNASNTRVNYSDTITVITQGNTCSAVSIGTQPQNQTGCVGSTVSFTVAAGGTTPGYQWQVSTDGGTSWNDIPGETNATLVINNITAAQNNFLYRAIITNSCPSTLTSGTASLTVSSAASITNAPVNVTACEGTAATFSVTASGSNLTYQWQISTDGGLSFNDITGATGSTFTIPAVTPGLNNNQYRVIISSCGPTNITSSAATLAVNAAQIISLQPAGATTCPGGDVTFNTSATGVNVTYQWQVSTDGGTNFNDLAGETNSSLTLTSVTSSMNNNRYRAIISSTCNLTGAATNAAILNVATLASITVQPASVSACEGSLATLSTTATGTGLAYQWQVSENGGAFTDLLDNSIYSGTTSAALQIMNAALSMNDNVYRVIVDASGCGNVVSNEASIEVIVVPEVVITASGNNPITTNQTVQLTASVTPAGNYTYQWFRNSDAVLSANNAQITVAAAEAGQYHVELVGVNGCGASSNTITVSAILNQSFIFPNPSHGTFTVRHFYNGTIGMIRSVRVYNSIGQCVIRKSNLVTGSDPLMVINMNWAAKGVYMVELIDENGERVATGKVIIE